MNDSGSDNCMIVPLAGVRHGSTARDQHFRRASACCSDTPDMMSRLSSDGTPRDPF